MHRECDFGAQSKSIHGERSHQNYHNVVAWSSLLFESLGGKKKQGLMTRPMMVV